MLCEKLNLDEAEKKYPETNSFPINSNVGIEVELERIDLQLNPKYLIEDDDGSIRNGREYISNGPINGEGLTEAMNDFHIQSLRKGADPDLCCNHRCSTHIHVDMTDMNDEDELYTFLLLSLFMEPTIFNCFDNESRKESIYCVPLYKQDWYLNVLNEGIRNKDLYDISQQSQKYSAINLNRLVNGAGEEVGLGTIEFRMFPATLDGNDLRKWVNILLSMKLYATTHSVEDVRGLSNFLSRMGTETFLYEIFGNEGAELLLPSADYGRLLLGARTVERVLFNKNDEAVERLFNIQGKKYKHFKETNAYQNVQALGGADVVDDPPGGLPRAQWAINPMQNQVQMPRIPRVAVQMDEDDEEDEEFEELNDNEEE